jgi:flagella basal body P-ring formation protein FlgA
MIRFAFGILLWALAWGLGTPARAGDAAPMAVPTVTIPVLARDLAAGEVVSADDLVDLPVQGPVAGSVVQREQDIIGLAARKPLRAGRPIALSELRQPILVAKGSLVNIRVSMPGIELSTTAKAIEQGAMGEVVRVMNLTSNRIIQAVITGPGEAQVPVTAAPAVPLTPEG